MRIVPYAIVAALGLASIPGSARAQSTEDVSPPGLRIEVGVRAGATGGGPVLGRVLVTGLDVTGLEEPHWLDGEIDSGRSMGVVLAIQPAGLPVAFRATFDRATDALLLIRTRGCGAGPETICRTDSDAAEMAAAFGDVLWYLANNGRERLFVFGGAGAVHYDVDSPFRCIPEVTPCTLRWPFYGENTDPAMRGGLGLDLRAGRIRLSGETGLLGSRFEPADGAGEPNWAALFLLSIGARVAIR